jgi:hypothetical protein
MGFIPVLRNALAALLFLTIGQSSEQLKVAESLGVGVKAFRIADHSNGQPFHPSVCSRRCDAARWQRVDFHSASKPM